LRPTGPFARRWLRAATLALALAGVASPQPAPNRPPLKLGLLLPPAEPEAQSIRRGAELGLAAANREPGVPLDLVVRGQPGQWGTEGDDAVVLALDEGAAALIAPTTGAAVHQALQVAGRTRLPVVSLCSDSSVTSAGLPWAIRIAPRTDAEAAAIFAVLRHPTRPPRCLPAVPTDRPGREILHDLETAAATATPDLQLLKPVHVPPPAEDLGALARDVLAANPDVVLLWLEPAASGRFARQLAQLGCRGRPPGHSRLLAPSFFAALGTALPARRWVHGLLVPAPLAATRSNPARDDFLRACSAPLAPPTGESASPLNTPAPFDLGAALAYDAVRLLADVLRRAGERPPYREFPLQHTMPGATGPLAFDPAGNRQWELEVLEWRPDGVRVVHPQPRP